MKEHAATSRRRRTSATPGTAARRARKAPADLSAPINAARRHALIAEAAYFRAEARGFACAGMVEDWLTAENEVDRQLLSDNAGPEQE